MTWDREDLRARLMRLTESAETLASMPPRAAERPAEVPPDIPWVQSIAQKLYGMEPAKIPKPKKPLIPEVETPSVLLEADQQSRDIGAALDTQSGLGGRPKGNLPAKVETLKRWSERDEEPITEKGILEILGRTKSGAVKELREIPAMLGLVPALVRSGAETTRSIMRSAAGRAGIESTQVHLPDGQTFDFYQPISEMDPALKDKLIRAGAHFGPPQEGESFLDAVLESEKERFGLVNPEDIPDDATSFGIPLIGRESRGPGEATTRRRFVPRRFLEETVERPISRLLDILLLAGAPGIAARGTASGLSGGARVAAKAGAETAERGLVKASLAATSAAEKVERPVSRGVKYLTRKGISLSPAGREFLAGWDAKMWARTAVKESQELSWARRHMAEVERAKAFNKLTDDELKLLPLVIEGRASIRPEALTPQMSHALDVVKGQIRTAQDELIQGGFLAGTTAEERQWAPLVVARTGKRLPPRDWDAKRVARENRKLEKINDKAVGAGVRKEHERIPGYLTPEQVTAEIGAVKAAWTATVQDMFSIPVVTTHHPHYFPRFAEPPTMREILHEFFPTTGKRPGRLPIQKEFTGASILRNIDVKDVAGQLDRHNAQVRRIVDSDALIRSLVDSPHTKALKLDKQGRPLNLLPGHVMYAPEGFLKFYKGQFNLGVETAKALDAMGDFESALAQGVRAALGDDLTRSYIGVQRRTKMYQIPAQMATEINKQFQATHPLVRLFWDKPTDLWRSAVLAYSPRWHVNNLIGGLVLGTTAGVPPHRLLKPLTRAEKAALPEQLIAQSQVFVDTFKPHLGSAADTAMGRVYQAIANSKPIKLGTRPLAVVRDKSYGANQLIDNHFRSRAYLEIGRREARNQLMKETGRAVISSREILRRVADMSADPTSQRQLLRALNKVYFNFNNMTHFERKYMRRVIPFWSWFREINRVALTLPNRAPGQAQALRLLGEMGKQADDEEVRQHLGIPKKYLPEYTQDLVFTGLDNEGRVVFYSPRGANVFYGVGKWPIDTTVLHPIIRTAMAEMTGGKSFGRWGSYAPFRYKEAGERLELDPQTGRLRRSRPFRSWGKKVARNIPLVSLLEDLVQYGTEGVVSQRFEDVTPLSNVPEALTGGQIEPTAIYDRELEPRRERTHGEVWKSFFGVGSSRYRLEEMLEQEIKGSRKDVNAIFDNLFNSNPEFRDLYMEVLSEMAGQPERPLETIHGR